MYPFGRLLNVGARILFPGPADGRNGLLRQQILSLESIKRDSKLQQLFELEERAPARSAWVGLGTIAYEIVKHFKPKKIVELGSFGGFSTCAMGLALRDLGQGGLIYAVDTWSGDDHTGPFGEQVYRSFLERRSELGLASNIFPLRMTFEEASEKIAPPIDMLHVDGWHTFAAVFRDFKTFRRHLAPGAIVLFHDVYTYFPGMRLFWAVTARRFPSYLIPYSHGLGIIQIPGPNTEPSSS
jgi:predicted O-methyltransferase YrrM